ncbi:MAG: circadian clock protein KaiB [Desulfovibrionaceae bacterium]|jgi:circadian clock protein KaiB|nr:circadian clock protein KaiB [Desulfovibrionaceae bacterium]
MEVRYSFKLFVTGATPRSRRAENNLRELCEAELGGRCDVEVVDILAHPELAEDEHILATPMLLKRSPGPVRRYVGDLSDRGRIRLDLGLDPGPSHLAAAES